MVGLSFPCSRSRAVGNDIVPLGEKKILNIVSGVSRTSGLATGLKGSPLENSAISVATSRYTNTRHRSPCPE